MELEMAAYTDWIRAERGSPAHCVPGTDGACAARIGLHDPVSESLEDRFTPQCCRRWLVTHLLRAGMSRDHVKWIRDDAMKELIDIYCHMDAENVRKSYMAYVP